MRLSGKRRTALWLAGAGALILSPAAWAGAPAVAYTEVEKNKILSHGPWPPERVRDPSNRVSGNVSAAALGERLFFEPRLSGTGSVLCATCHAPFRGFQDNRPRGKGLEEVDRNTPTVLDVRFSRWFGWDGANDSLWAQSIRPLLDRREMRSSPKHVADFVKNDPFFSRGYEDVFGKAANDEEVLVNVGKALAAYQETLVSGRTPFDDFRDALERNDPVSAAKYPASAQRGLRIFIGKGGCDACHVGPRFTNGEFANTGVPFLKVDGEPDRGRQGGIAKLKASPFNLLGRYNDDPKRASAAGTRRVEAQPGNFGEFRVPGLRNVARTSPYMHNGSLATLRDVVEHHSKDGGRLPKPLHLSDEEAADLVSFLESLSDGAH